MSLNSSNVVFPDVARLNILIISDIYIKQTYSFILRKTCNIPIHISTHTHCFSVLCGLKYCVSANRDKHNQAFLAIPYFTVLLEITP